MASSNITLTNNSDTSDLLELEGKSQVYCGSIPIKKCITAIKRLNPFTMAQNLYNNKKGG